VTEAWALVLLFLSSTVVALSGAMMPGPMLTAVVTETPRHGAKAGPLVVLGHGILELILLLLLVIGLQPLLTDETVQAALQIAGGLMLVWTGVAMIVAVARRRVSLDWDADDRGARARTVWMGIVSSLANPYWTIWWATIGLSLLTKAYALGLAGLVAFYIGHIIGDLTWYSLVSGALAAGRRFITPGAYRVMLVVAAAFLLCLAAWFLASGLRTVV
jgi:threonine/homoserine/homoserine lactone efflux protein